MLFTNTLLKVKKPENKRELLLPKTGSFFPDKNKKKQLFGKQSEQKIVTPEHENWIY